MRKISWIVAVAILAICCGAMAVKIPTQTIANTANVFTPKANITAYSDEACTQLLEKIDWGNIYEGREYSKTFWVKNEGDDAVSAEWHDDIEEVRPLRYDDADMEYYNESRQYWRWWWEEYGIIPPPPTLAPTNVTPRGYVRVNVTPVVPPVGEPYLEPGEKVKVRYTIEFEVSPLQDPSEIPLPVRCEWNLTLGY